MAIKHSRMKCVLPVIPLWGITYTEWKSFVYKKVSYHLLRMTMLIEASFYSIHGEEWIKKLYKALEKTIKTSSKELSETFEMHNNLFTNFTSLNSTIRWA